jgi:hypothetical protein
MTDVHILAIDLAKRSFQVCGRTLSWVPSSNFRSPQVLRLARG